MGQHCHEEKVFHQFELVVSSATRESSVVQLELIIRWGVDSTAREVFVPSTYMQACMHGFIVMLAFWSGITRPLLFQGAVAIRFREFEGP